MRCWECLREGPNERKRETAKVGGCEGGTAGVLLVGEVEALSVST